MNPITPDEVVRKAATLIRDDAVEVFNELILEGWDGSCACIPLDYAASRMAERRRVYPGEIDRSWEDIKTAYELAGWDVHYYAGGRWLDDKPAALTFRIRSQPGMISGNTLTT